MAKGFVSQFADAARIVDGKKIDSLNEDFTLNGLPFTLQFVPKSPDDTSEYVMASIRMYQSDAHQLWPMPVLAWCSEMVISLSAESASLLDDFDIYAGTGGDIINN